MPQLQILITGILCVAIFTCWLVFSSSTFNIGITPIIAILFLLISLGLVFWVFFSASGKAFAHKYNKLQQQIAEVEGKISLLTQTRLKESNYTKVMLDFQELYTFSEVSEWDKNAGITIKKIMDLIQNIEIEIDAHKDVLNQWKKKELQKKHISVLENMAEKLQEAIDFTPNSSKEQKALLKELRHQKKELQLQKREVTANMKLIQAKARSRSVYAGKGFLGIYNSKLAASERRRIRYQKEAELNPSEDIKAAIERQIMQIDKNILWVERFSE
ncbi:MULTISPECIES: hypothetical protein [unclassified Nostoc]|uniref:hypothetical protein n=1 Tax=unclassified Nostoc TaxID=2593658 RepID=UPI002AD45D4B|nr:hypothetical protein [Nostoc sp. DedQUE03]MDZ7976576.1 hypothetical protein [Nostoc sp. DedQUE03]MDZ8049156.1 hypothetical protein [Nostoc sp. DedQUE02]